MNAFLASAAVFLAPVWSAILAYVAKYGIDVLYRVAPVAATALLAVAFHLLDLHFGGNAITRFLFGALTLGLGVSVFLVGFEVGQLVPTVQVPAPPAPPVKS